jgi:hypothetical protein
MNSPYAMSSRREFGYQTIVAILYLQEIAANCHPIPD